MPVTRVHLARACAPRARARMQPVPHTCTYRCGHKQVAHLPLTRAQGETAGKKRWATTLKSIFLDAVLAFKDVQYQG